MPDGTMGEAKVGVQRERGVGTGTQLMHSIDCKHPIGFDQCLTVM